MRFLLSLFFLSQLGTVFAQSLVDPRLIQYLNRRYPTLVQADGQITNLEDHDGISLVLNVSWNPVNLSGLELFTYSSLEINFTRGIEVTWPDRSINGDGSGQATVELINYPMDTLPDVFGVYELIVNGGRAKHFGRLGQGLGMLAVEGLSELRSPPVFGQDRIEEIKLSDYPAGIPWPQLPDSVDLVEYVRSDKEEIPPLPRFVSRVNLAHMMNMRGLLSHASLMDSQIGISLTNVGIDQVVIRDVGNPGLSISIYGAPNLFSAEFSGVGGATIDMAPLLRSVDFVGRDQQVFPSYYQSQLYLRNIGNGVIIRVSSVRGLGIASAENVFLESNSGISSLYLSGSPGFRWNGDLDSVRDLFITGRVPISDMIPVLPANLSQLEIDGPGHEVIPSLPSSLRYFSVTPRAATRCLPILPEGLIGLHCPSIPCLPNIPVGIRTSIPLCTVLNSECPDNVPYVRGRVYVDMDEDGMIGPDDPLYPLGHVVADPGRHAASVDTAAVYALGLPPGMYDLRYVDPQGRFLPVLNGARTVETIAGTDGVDNVDFLLPRDSVELLTWNVSFEGSVARPGFEHRSNFELVNTGLLPIAELVLRYRSDMAFSTGTAWCPGVVEPDGDCSVTVTDIPVGGRYGLFPVQRTAVTTPLGYIYQDTVFVQARSSVGDTMDSYHVLSGTVVGSYDPNDKLVTPATILPEVLESGTWLRYRIRFQNTGTYHAERVVITDTLSTDLLWETFRYESASHTNRWYIRDGVLHFVFDGIMLPDSNSNEPESHGHVFFSIRTRPGLGLTDTIANIANIYFDFNEPVITDPAVLRVDRSMEVPRISAVAEESFCFPVPTDGILQVRTDSHAPVMLRVFDAHGRAVITQQAQSSVALLDLAGYPAGIYMVQLVHADGNVRTQRVVKR